MQDTLAVVLGGGRGSRLFPLTLVRSKPAVPLGGTYRLIDVAISNCINSRINKIFVLTQFNSESLNRHINQTYQLGLFSRGFVDVLAAEQTPESLRWYQGTADAVRQTLHHMLNYQVSKVLILSGDHLYRMDFRKLVAFHEEKRADITVSSISVALGQASGFGILKADRDGRIREFYEKPQDPKLLDSLKLDMRTWRKHGLSAGRPLLASMGIYLFKTEILRRVLEDETRMDFGKEVLPAALGEHRVYGYVFDEYWQDIGTIAAFYKANLDLTTLNPRFTFYDPSAPIYTHPRFLPASRVHSCQIKSSILSEGCLIHDATIQDSVIGIRSVIREETLLRRTLMMGADDYQSVPPGSIPIGVGPKTIIEGAIVDKNARIGKSVRILNQKGHSHYDGGNYFVRDGVVVIPKNAVIEDGTEI